MCCHFFLLFSIEMVSSKKGRPKNSVAKCKLKIKNFIYRQELSITVIVVAVCSVVRLGRGEVSRGGRVYGRGFGRAFGRSLPSAGLCR
jgi:hypothetical protein